MISPGQDVPGDPRLDEQSNPPEESEHEVRLPAGTSLKLDRLQRSLEAARQREAALHAELARLRQETSAGDDPIDAAGRAAQLIVDTAAEQARRIIASAERQALQLAEMSQEVEQRTEAAFPPRPTGPRGRSPEGPGEAGGTSIPAAAAAPDSSSVAAGADEARGLVEAATAAVGDLGRSLLQLEGRFAAASKTAPQPPSPTAPGPERDDAATAGGGGKVLLKAGPFPNRVTLARFQRALSELPGVLDAEAGGLEGEWTTMTVRTNPGTQLAHVMRAELGYAFAVDPPAADGRYTITLGNTPS